MKFSVYLSGLVAVSVFISAAADVVTPDTTPAAVPATVSTNTPTDGISVATGKPDFSFGGDLRVRQEIMHNIPGLPGAPGAMMPLAMKKNLNHIRVRPRVWGRLDSEQFTLYGRITDEIREHIVDNNTPRKYRTYNFPDEIFLDNLYFECRELFGGFLDFRIGRQDPVEKGHSVIGLDRLFMDGSSYDGSRSAFVDMIKFTFHTSETSKLDAFALYNNGRDNISWGTRRSRGRPVNAIHPGDSPEMDEWGGGLVWHDNLFEKSLPYRAYVIHKRNESYTAPSGRRIGDKQITTVGLNILPVLTENISFEFDGAQQFGTCANGSRQAGGTMGYAAIDFHRAESARGLKPYTRLSVYYLSGDKHFTGENDNDTAWDPLWGRWPQDSELFQYGTLYGLGYWNNIVYPKITFGTAIGPRHRLCAYTGPLFAAEQDGAGHADGSGDSMFKGLLSSIRYDIPIRLAPKNASGFDRFEIYGHLVAELFNPGNYYDTSRPSYFFRWEVSFAF